MSLFPLLTDIPAGKVVHATSAGNDDQSSAAASVKNTQQMMPAQLTCLTASSYNRTSSSSLVSLNEDLLAGELQAVNWSSTDASSTSASVFRPLNTNSLSPASVSNSSSPSLTSISRPTSVQSEREIQYAQLDLTPSAKTRRASGEQSSESQEPPRSPRQFTRTVACETLPSVCTTTAGALTTYAQIDFKKS